MLMYLEKSYFTQLMNPLIIWRAERHGFLMRRPVEIIKLQIY